MLVWPLSSLLYGSPLDVLDNQNCSHFFFPFSEDRDGFHAVSQNPKAMLQLLRTVLQRNARLEAAQRRLTEQALTDPLTGLGNRRWLFDRLDALWADCIRRQSTCWVMMVDLDHFKRVNDSHGHHAGDAMLVAVAGTLRDVVRRSDVLGRFGGEEFCLAGPGDLETASTLADRLLSAIRQLRVYSEGVELKITASLGGTLVSPAPAGPRLWAALQAADTALYRAKANGRDCSSFDTSPSSSPCFPSD